MDAAPQMTASITERTIKTVDGLDLFVRDYAPVAPVTGLPVICLHGLTRNSKDFEIVAPRIAALGRRVIAPDMRGRGRSPHDPDPAHYVAAVYAQDVLAMLNALEIPEAVFIGTSMGGIITMVVAALAPDRIAATVLNDVGPKLESAALARISNYVGAAKVMGNWAEAAQATKAVNGAAFPQRADDTAFWDAFAQRLYKQRADGLVEVDYDLSIALAFSDPETTPAIDMSPLFRALAAKPVLSVHGALSDLLSAEGVALMQSLKPDMDAVTIPQIGHAPMLDEPEAWDALLGFLAKVN
jgi:pimeloyl-ACP methyl ester carboxylesterase